MTRIKDLGWAWVPIIVAAYLGIHLIWWWAR